MWRHLENESEQAYLRYNGWHISPLPEVPSLHWRGISRFYLHTHAFIHEQNEPLLSLPSQPKLVLIFWPRRDGRLSWLSICMMFVWTVPVGLLNWLKVVWRRQIGEKFRSRALEFSGLISGCTIDWFQRWPRDALISVADHFLSRFDVDCAVKVKSQLIRCMGTIHDNIAESCAAYFQK